jgi:hypothetical protein
MVVSLIQLAPGCVPAPYSSPDWLTLEMQQVGFYTISTSSASNLGFAACFPWVENKLFSLGFAEIQIQQSLSA